MDKSSVGIDEEEGKTGTGGEGCGRGGWGKGEGEGLVEEVWSCVSGEAASLHLMFLNLIGALFVVMYWSFILTFLIGGLFRIWFS